jgi:hemoglobin-like flavoprotein
MALAEVKESYSRCCVNPKFFDLFYQKFLSSHPSIAPMFAKTDMTKQKSLLRQGVSMMFMHLGGNSVGTTGIDRIGESHSKQKMNIDPNLYDFWINSLVGAVKECDTRLTTELEADWRKVLRQGVDRIVSFYNKK